MKNRICILFMLTLALSAHSQQLNYEVLKDEPKEPAVSINLDFFNLDMNTGYPNLRLDNISMNLGVFGFVQIIQPLEIDFNIHKSWLALGKIGFKEYPGNFELNTGVNFWLTDRNISKKTKIVLKQTETRTSSETITSTTYIMAPAQHIKRFGFRGGLYSKSGPFNFDEYTDGVDLSGIEETKISSMGLYGGLTFRNLTNIIITDEHFGRSMNSVGRDIYFDAFFVPVNRFKDLNAEGALVTETVKDFKSVLPFGFRVGFRSYQIEKRKMTMKKFGMAALGEFGYKPYQGWFITAGIGITIVKR